ncbi:type IV pilus modification protein PilV [Marinicella litoralis]|uniref:Type IV pilus assembly protein PilV n=1 Tax=Marinicella litoralis TaxID=644220 RepID=A0A4R6XKJ8_9GAMM|nr:type IV pilus modification protein PilV [Marinicella litoralis]TDR18424.1 type IV pilus assembly protein PilV [Marinicella litoralis]
MKVFKSKKEQGFTLLEVLVSVLVFSFGLLGIAGMMTISVRNNHNGYLRSQANFLAENMMDRMRSNPTALWAGAYNGLAANGTTDCSLTGTPPVTGTPCNFNQLAAYDTESWARSLAQYLPAGQGTITCVANSALSAFINPASPPSIWFPAPPFDGVCTITIQWNEADRDSAQSAQTLSLVGQP